MRLKLGGPRASGGGLGNDWELGQMPRRTSDRCNAHLNLSRRSQSAGETGRPGRSALRAGVAAKTRVSHVSSADTHRARVQEARGKLASRRTFGGFASLK